jgi:hypothetical protein
MLMSRGFIYTSAKAAGKKNPTDKEKWHLNCQCYALPVYSEAEYRTSDIYKLNRMLQDLWPTVTGKYSGGNSKARAWRRYLRKHPIAPGAQVSPGGDNNSA